MDRRGALTFFLLSAAWLGCVPVRAQSIPNLRRVGFLAPLYRSTRDHPDPFYEAFVAGMRQLGYQENKNFALEWRFADGQFDRLPALATELVRTQPEVIVTHATPAIRALRKATATIPIVFATAIDPVASGLVSSLAHPGGNITGVASNDFDPSAKRLELLKRIAPGVSRVGVLLNPLNPAHGSLKGSVESAAKELRVQVSVVQATNGAEINNVFSAAKRQLDAILVPDDALFRGQRNQLAKLSLENKVPVITPWKEFVQAGGLISYGQDISASFHLAATYVDKILKGAKPADLPVERPSKIFLSINRKTASALGLRLPTDLLIMADDVVE